MRHPALEKWEIRLRKVFDEVDHQLEDRYGRLYDLKPSRRDRGEATTSDADGLFDLGVNFTGGFGSNFGSGYVFRVGIATLDHVPPTVRSEIESVTLELVKSRLSQEFPEKQLSLERDGNVYKIFGDLSLD